MRTRLRRLLTAVTHPDPGYDTAPIPARGDAVETWLKTQRDRHTDGYGPTPGWWALDDALDH